MGKIKALFIFTAIIIFTACLLLPGVVTAETCYKSVARVVSAQGNIQAQIKGRGEWVPVQLNHEVCPGDMIRVQKQSRAAILMTNETIIRLDQNTTVTFTEAEKKKTSLLDIITGIVHFISRVPRTLKVSTPFVNGTVEGTEFLVSVFKEHALISVFEGQVLAYNDAGSLTLRSGQSAIAEAGKAPVLKVVVQPRDAVQWALYYPPIMEYQEEVSQDVSEPRSLVNQAALLLSTGRVDEAVSHIERALKSAPDNSQAIALQSIIAVVQNDKGRALSLAQKAVEADPDAAAAWIALSYARQANFDLDGALASLEKAVELEPEDSLAWARLAEIRLSFGSLDDALEAAKKAVDLNPDLALTQTVLGFAFLSQVKTEEAIKVFEKAIQLDQADPLPRLGLGLAKIRKGDLKAGRREIEIAASLDPGQSIIRSYLGKAYYEEKRDKLAMGQYAMAQDMDQNDPTPFFYDAILKQSLNRPVEALHDLQKSIELNDNRAIYRSKLLLDEDLAARSASLARIYNDLGFQQLALIEGWKSVNIDPGNYSAHRFLADSYSALPRHEIARVSELLQSQLLQSVNITPVQPQLAESSLFILDGSGPAQHSFNEFNPVFNRNRFALQLSGIAGENSTLGNELVISGVHDKVSFSIGQFHYETDGFRENNDQDLDIYNVFAQMNLSHKTSIQAEARFNNFERGDLPLFFNSDSFLPNLRDEEQTNTLRFGLHHTIAPHSDVIASLIYQDTDFDTSLLPELEIETDEDGYMAEVQYLFHAERLKITGGAGYSGSNLDDISTMTFVIDPLLPPMTDITTFEGDISHTNFYIYSLINYPEKVNWTVGASADIFEGGIVDQNQLNPKFGITFNPLPDTTLRATVFRTFKRTLISSQTIEPTQVAGFNQFFEDGEGTDAWRYGIGIDQKLSEKLYAGGELSKRELSEPGEIFDETTFDLIIKEFDVDEELGRAYVYWTPYPWLALSTEYQYEHFINTEEFMKNDIFELDTHRIILGINFFHQSGFFAKLRPSYISQNGEFASLNPFDPFATFKGDDKFWVVDASIGYRLPNRYGIVTVEVRNLFDEDFRFQDTDPSNPKIYPDRFVLIKFTLAF